MSKQNISISVVDFWPKLELDAINFILSAFKKYNVVDRVNADKHIAIKSLFGKTKVNDSDFTIFYSGEPFAVEYQKYNFSIGMDYLDSDNYYRLPQYFLYDARSKIGVSYDRECCNPNQKLFACFLYSNQGNAYYEGAKIRYELFQQLAKYKFVASGGAYANNIGYVIPQDDQSTMEWLGQCKFVIAYENHMREGYITEKVVRAYYAGSMPIYWGHNSVLSELNKDAVIYAPDFENNDALINYIAMLDNNDEAYCQKWQQNLFRDGYSYSDEISKLHAKMMPLIDDYVNEHVLNI